MARKIKADTSEIKVDIGYDISQFKQQSSQITAEINKTKKSAEMLGKSLKVKYNDATFVSAQKSAQSAVDATQKKVTLLKEHIEKLEKSGNTEKARGEYEKLQSMLESAKEKAIQAKIKLDEINRIKTNNLISEIKKTTSAIDKEISNAQTYTDVLKNHLNQKFDNSTFEKAQQSARNVVDATNKKVEALKENLKKIETAGKTDELCDEYKDLQAQIKIAEEKAIDAKRQLERINNIK